MPLGAPVQIAYAVVDVNTAALRWATDFGAGPFFVRPHIPVTSVVYRGEPGAFDHSSAYGQWGSIMVELVQDHTAGPSAINERYHDGASGLHHLAYFVDNLDATTAALNGLGFATAMTGQAGTTRFHFIDAVESMGHMIELYEPTDHLRAFYAKVADASRQWDHHDPVRLR